MSKHLLTLLFLFSVATTLLSQEPTNNDSIAIQSDSTEWIPEIFEADIDSLLNSLHGQYFTRRNEFCHDEELDIVLHDSVYIERLSRLPRLIELTYNKDVRRCIELYVVRQKGLLRYILGMADFYFPMIEQTLNAHELPIELKYLAVVESGLNPEALSRVGATGIWQFMLPTGRSCGLEVNSLIDERRDPLKSTEAACKYFKDMYDVYQDWHLVLASYNCGPGNVNRAIRRAGGKRDFWKIYPYLPKETRLYVPLFIAVNYAMNYHCEHNICPVGSDRPAVMDTVMVNKILHFKQISEVLNIEEEQLKLLNPQYTRGLIPGNVKPQVLNLPLDQTYAFVENEDTIYTHKAEELLSGLKGGLPTKERITYVVPKTETLYQVANRYGVSAKEIRTWNRLRSNKVYKGKRLVLYINNGGVSNQQQTVASVKGSKLVASSAAAVPASGNTYRVKSGDSLYTIAKKYPGVSAKDLQRMNNLGNSTRLQPGQVLVVSAK
jgi:membrane-bound lytic murein transglycosylase D